jgi:hypothetical protein
MVKKAIGTYLFKTKFKGVLVIDPYTAINNLGPELYADPVRLKQAGYDGLATRVMEIWLAQLEEKHPQIHLQLNSIA